MHIAVQQQARPGKRDEWERSIDILFDSRKLLKVTANGE